MSIQRIPVEDIVIDGTNEEGQMETGAANTPFALFSPTLQTNVGGPYAELNHAQAALDAIKSRKMLPYGFCIWTIDGKDI